MKGEYGFGRLNPSKPNVLLAVNVPTVSFGLAMGWVSLASGEAAAAEAGEGDGALVGAAAATFAAGLAGVPLGAHALRHGRRPALAATSAVFGVLLLYYITRSFYILL